MRYAILSDVHANGSALAAVLTDAQDAGAERVYCLGDVLGYGPDPVAALELVHDRVHVCLLGNHDAAVCDRFPVEDFTDVAARAVKSHREKLSPRALEWLKTLPYVCESTDFACAHGDFSDPEAFNYILEPEDALPSWQCRKEQLLFVGHTHRPGVYVLGQSGKPHFLDAVDFVLEEGKRYIVNVGSVGYPRNGACRSFYCIYDDQTRSVFFRSLPFDLEGFRRKMNGAGLDEAPWIAARSKDRMRPVVRVKENFAKKTVAPSGKKAITGGIAEPVPVSAPMRQGLGPALILGALLIAFAGVFCTYRLVKAMPDPSAGKAVEEIDVADVASGVSEKNVPAFDINSPVALSGDWTAYLEVPSRQSVRIVRNSRKNVMAFRIESDGEGWVRFVRRRSLFEKPSVVYTVVENLTRPPPGKKSAFAFNTRLLFFDGKGNVSGVPFLGGGKISARKKVSVPEGAEAAEFRVDCRVCGVHELSVPHFSPEEPKTVKRKKEKE